VIRAVVFPAESGRSRPAVVRRATTAGWVGDGLVVDGVDRRRCGSSKVAFTRDDGTTFDLLVFDFVVGGISPERFRRHVQGGTVAAENARSRRGKAAGRRCDKTVKEKT